MKKEMYGKSLTPREIDIGPDEICQMPFKV